MIRWAPIGRVLGLFLAAFGGPMAFPVAYSLSTSRDDLPALVVAMAVTTGAGILLWWLCRHNARELTQREGILLTVSTWLAATSFGSLPFVLSPGIDTLTDAVFEATSGITATGATILDEVEVLSRPILLWRSTLHWLGGLGIVVLVIAILPLVGHGGMHLYRAEFSGAKSEKLTPRIAETATSLWGIYVALTVALFLLLLLAGMGPFDAIAHAFTTIATGGFSPRTASVGAFQSPLIEYIIIAFMILGGASFILHYRVWLERKPLSLLRDYEFRSYLGAIGIASAVAAMLLSVHLGYGAEKAARTALFQVTSISTTTGLVTDDFERWPPLGQLILLALMFIGGCTGSTAGGMKFSRIALLAKVVGREFKRMVERHGVFAVRLGGSVVREATIQSLLNLVYLAFLINFASCLALAALGVDVFTAITAVAATMFNIGPALGAVGPMDHYGHLPPLAKWVLSVDMLAGRLEYYTLLVTLTPWFWRK